MSPGQQCQVRGCCCAQGHEQLPVSPIEASFSAHSMLSQLRPMDTSRYTWLQPDSIVCLIESLCALQAQFRQLSTASGSAQTLQTVLLAR